MRLFCRFLLLLALLADVPLFAQQLQNPVLKGVADAGVIRYAGKYYIGGVRTYGDFYVSDDLVNWNKKIHVFDLDNDWTHGTGAKNNQVHADDISYSNGLFHLLFSVNYWGKDRHIVHITHAVSPTVEGPYKEVRKDQWTENRIDPMAFRDDNGKLYLYMVKFTDGNAIWVRPMNQDFSFSGDAMLQFSSQPDTWETLDNRVAEGPFVVKYRGRYYMMYNANHTAPEYGNYRLGVCEASSPMTFNTGGKYSYPVVGPRTDRSLQDQALETSTDTLFTPGQPNIVRGPNGWEWWLVYMANQGNRRDQYIDRIHFTNNRLYVDGITGKNTPGFHPVPAKPEYSGKSIDSLRTSDAFLLELTFTSDAVRQGIRIGEIDYLLPDSFPRGVPHIWRIEKNHDQISLWIDQVLLKDHVQGSIPDGSSIRWIGGGQQYQIANVSFTNGWDEYGKYFSGWNPFEVTDGGLQLTANESLKGPSATSYSFSAMLGNRQPQVGRYGVYAMYVDSRNYVKVVLDVAKKQLITESCFKGKTSISVKPLSRYDVQYPDIKYSDSFEKQYRFDSPTLVSGILCQMEKGKSVIGTQQLSYLDGTTWRPLDVTIGPSTYNGYEEVKFDAVQTRAIRMINSEPTDLQRHVYRIETRCDLASQYQLRVERREGELYIYLDNHEMEHILLSHSLPARIGLFSDGKDSVFVENSLYYPVK